LPCVAHGNHLAHAERQSVEAMVALSYRIGATAAAGMPVTPTTPFSGLEAIVHFRAPLTLL
jgi:hypothetical protein